MEVGISVFPGGDKESFSFLWDEWVGVEDREFGYVVILFQELEDSLEGLAVVVVEEIWDVF